nr:hypothetical protein [uncultured Anaerobutyricum sp.]
MLKRRKKKVINVSTVEYDDLIKMIENMDGVSVRRTINNGVQISIYKQALENSSVGICVRKKNRKGKRIEHLTPIYSTEKEDALQFRQSSAIIAKASRS